MKARAPRAGARYTPDEIARAARWREEEGLTYAAIARRLGRNPTTCLNHLSQLLRRAGCRVRAGHANRSRAWEDYPPSDVPEVEARILEYRRRLEEGLPLFDGLPPLFAPKEKAS